jgi:two-component system sensor histidine kinase SenX3
MVELFGPPKMAFVISAQPLPHGHSVAFVDDISERRRVEQTRTDFVANISHELKTPVGALSVLAETLIDETDLATIARVVTRMLAETDRASRTIDDLMELSRIEMGAERSDEPVRIADVIRSGVERVTELAARDGITISSLTTVETDVRQADALIVVADRRQLVSAVGNLIENAVKYSEPGTSVQVRARRVDDWIEISVADQGVGIPQRDLDRVFERFYRVDRARSRTTGGTGLGLAIVRHVASNHGGDVSVASVEGEGSTFVLRLPISADDTNPSQSHGSTEGVA